MYKQSAQDLTHKLYSNKEQPKQLTIETKLDILESPATWPFDVWSREKDFTISLIETDIAEYRHLIKLRMDDLELRVKAFVENEEPLICGDVQVQNTHWTLNTAYIMHHMNRLNELKILLCRANKCEYKGM